MLSMCTDTLCSRLLGEDVTVTVQQEAGSGDRRRILIPENIQILFLVF